MKTTRLTCVLALTLAACGGGGGGDDVPVPDAGPSYPQGFNPPSVPVGGAQFLGKPFTVQPGEEVFKCVYLDGELPAELDVAGLQTYQMSGGHHVIFSWVVDSYTPVDDVHECSDTEMIYHRFVAAGGADPNVYVHMPPGVALKVPGHKRFVIQSHYINSTDDVITVMDAVNLVPMTDPVVDYASMAAQIDDTFELAPGQTTIRDVTCNVTNPSQVFQLVGHTHEWGKKFQFELIHPDLSTEMLYENLDISPSFRDSAQQITWPPEAPLQLTPGDKLHLHCEWENTTTDTIYFPKEMCVAAFYYYPSRGFEVCGTDGGTFEPENINGKPAGLGAGVLR